MKSTGLVTGFSEKCSVSCRKHVMWRAVVAVLTAVAVT
jgi:hypothetical protein